MLKEGVKVFLGNSMDFDNRIEIAEGTMPFDGEIVEGIEYVKDSFVPKDGWRYINDTEKKFLIGYSDFKFNNDVGVVRISPELESMAGQLNINSIHSREEVVNLRKEKTEEYMEFSDKLKEFVADYLITKEKLHQIGWVVNNLPDRRTLTINFKANKYLGLHMDSWEGILLRNLGNAPNRICINFGKEDRFLLFINLTIGQAHSMISSTPPIDLDSLGQDQVTIDFFKQYPKYPVFRIRLKPYEAYIAPTENMIHDGNTQGVFSTDVHYTVRGFIKFKKN